MSRASSPVGDSKTESKQRRIESRLENDDEIQKTASDLAAKIINLAIEEIASGSSPDALAEEIFLQNEEKTENMSENIETLDNFHTDDDQIATVNIEIKNKNLIENWDANEGEARPFGLERASYLNEKNDIKAQKEITIDLDGVIANDSHVFINQVPICLHFPVSSLMVYEQGYKFFTGLSCKETNLFDKKSSVSNFVMLIRGGIRGRGHLSVSSGIRTPFLLLGDSRSPRHPLLAFNDIHLWANRP